MGPDSYSIWLSFKQQLQSSFPPPPPYPNTQVRVPNLGHCHNLYPQQADAITQLHTLRQRVEKIKQHIHSSLYSLPGGLFIVLMHCGTCSFIIPAVQKHKTMTQKEIPIFLRVFQYAFEAPEEMQILISFSLADSCVYWSCYHLEKITKTKD